MLSVTHKPFALSVVMQRVVMLSVVPLGKQTSYWGAVDCLRTWQVCPALSC
jgi:hypothetical protein